jgi:hypothetical protein
MVFFRTGEQASKSEHSTKVLKRSIIGEIHLHATVLQAPCLVAGHELVVAHLLCLSFDTRFRLLGLFLPIVVRRVLLLVSNVLAISDIDTRPQRPGGTLASSNISVRRCRISCSLMS